MVEGGDGLLDLAAITLDNDRVALAVSVHVPKDAALRVEQEGIDAVTGCEVADVVRNHAVQPAHAVAAGERNPGAEAEVIDSAAAGESREFLLRIGKVRCGPSSPISH